jgi:hypothetical protein
MIRFESQLDMERIQASLGCELLEFEVLTHPKHEEDSINEEPYCAKEEIRLDFSNGLEMRIYIDRHGSLCIYTD